MTCRKINITQSCGRPDPAALAWVVVFTALAVPLSTLDGSTKRATGELLGNLIKLNLCANIRQGI